MEALALSPETFGIPAGLLRSHYPTSLTTALFLLLAGAAFETRDFRPECSWLEDSTGLGWSRLSFVNVPVMALELVLARKAVVAAVLAPDHGAWELLLVRTGAMLGLVVASEVAKILCNDLTVLLETRILSWLTVVVSLVNIEL